MADARVAFRVTTGGTLAAMAAAGHLLRATSALELAAWEQAGAHPNPKLARQVLLEYGVADLGALPPGDVWRHLIAAAVHADPEHRLRLSQGYPVLIATVGAVEYLSDGVQRLVELLKPKE